LANSFGSEKYATFLPKVQACGTPHLLDH
jgi:hypothetical protein